MFTVKQLSRLAGVTPRTLHHYDAIGLLKPSSVGENGYRYYGEEALVRLQQILFYRELDLPLDEIRKIMGRRDFNALTALESHRIALQGEVTRLNQLLRTVDETILYLKGIKKMNPRNLFDGFSEKEQQEFEDEAARMYDPATVKASARKWQAYSPAEKKRIGLEGQQVYKDMIGVMDRDPSAPDVQAIVARWHKHIECFWVPDNDQLLGLADLYNSNPAFHANFEKTQPGLAAFMREAIEVYVQERKGKS